MELVSTSDSRLGFPINKCLKSGEKLSPSETVKSVNHVWPSLLQCHSLTLQFAIRLWEMPLCKLSLSNKPKREQERETVVTERGAATRQAQRNPADSPTRAHESLGRSTNIGNVFYLHPTESSQSVYAGAFYKCVLITHTYKPSTHRKLPNLTLTWRLRTWGDKIGRWQGV